MLLIAVISICAALSFGMAAAKKGYKSPRFWIYPLAAGAGMILLSYTAGRIARLVIKDQDSSLQKLHPYLVTLFAIAFLCVIVSKAWKQIKLLPPK
jgi:hypothetical protein